MQFESWVDRQIREAMERGEFDNLPGAGRPLELDDDPDWWIKAKIKRENLEPLLPTALSLRKEVEAVQDKLRGVRTEAAARAILQDLNERIRRFYATATGRPTVVVRLVDVEYELEVWARPGATTRDGFRSETPPSSLGLVMSTRFASNVADSEAESTPEFDGTPSAPSAPRPAKRTHAPDATQVPENGIESRAGNAIDEVAVSGDAVGAEDASDTGAVEGAPEPFKFKLSPLLASVPASVAAALLGSRLGVTGTLLGAALGAVVTGAVSQFATFGLERTHAGLKLVVARSRVGVAIGGVVVVALATFALTMGVLTAAESATGRSVDGGYTTTVQGAAQGRAATSGMKEAAGTASSNEAAVVPAANASATPEPTRTTSQATPAPTTTSTSTGTSTPTPTPAATSSATTTSKAPATTSPVSAAPTAP